MCIITYVSKTCTNLRIVLSYSYYLFAIFLLCICNYGWDYCRLKYGMMPYDPLDYESIDKVEFLVVEDNGDIELDYEEVEDKLEEEFSRNVETSSYDLLNCYYFMKLNF